MDTEQQAKIVRLIEDVIAADGVVTREERELLAGVRERFRMDRADGARLVAGDPGTAMAVLRALDPDVQLRVMALLVDAAVVDGCVAPEERAFLLAASAALGIEAQALEERIARRLPA